MLKFCLRFALPEKKRSIAPLFLTLHDLFTELQNLRRIFFLTGAEHLLVDGVSAQGHTHTNNADNNTGDHSAGQADDCADLSHHKAHACAHDNGTNRAVGVGEHIGRALDLCVQLFQRIQLGVLLFGLLGANLLHQKFLIVITHIDYLFHRFDVLFYEICPLSLAANHTGT